MLGELLSSLLGDGIAQALPGPSRRVRLLARAILIVAVVGVVVAVVLLL